MKTKLIYFVMLLGFLVAQPAMAQQSSKIDSVLKQRYKTYRAAKTVAKKEQLLNDLQAEYPEQETKGAGRYYDAIYTDLALTWLKKDKMDKYALYRDKVSDKQRVYGRLLGVIAGWNKKKENLPRAEDLGHHVVEYMEAQKEDSAKNYSSYYHAYALDTYAQTLQAMGKNDESLSNYKKSANIKEENDALQPDFINRYAGVLTNYGKDGEALNLLASAVMHDKYDDDILTKLKSSYAKTRGGTKGYDSYENALKEVGYQNTFTTVSEERMDTLKAAPTFTLKNLDGESVSLADMKGKVVIVDFWATWCGPCKASFPGMQLAVDKYKDDPDVEFLFVDVWQSEKNKQEVVQKFIDDKGYSFHVLMDSNDSVVKEFGVSGIPTKFVIDQKGNIQFKSVGSYGIDNQVLNKVTAMVEMAKSANGSDGIAE